MVNITFKKKKEKGKKDVTRNCSKVRSKISKKQNTYKPLQAFHHHSHMQYNWKKMNQPNLIRERKLAKLR